MAFRVCCLMMVQSVAVREPFFIDESIADPNLPDIMEIGGNLGDRSFLSERGRV